MKSSTILLALASNALVAFVKAIPVVENDMAVKTAAGMSAGCVMEVPAGGDPTKFNLCRQHPLGNGSPEHGVALGEVRKAQAAEEIAAECGSLGVLEVPEGVDPTKARKCRDHPLGDIQHPRLSAELAEHQALDNTSLANPLDNSLEKRACYHGKRYGCDKNFCWSNCGMPYEAGYWCWTAINYGYGEWARCTADEQCKPLKPDIWCGGKCSC